MADRDAFFSPALFRFLRDLKRNNQREWFLKNKQRYEEVVTTPMAAFLDALRPRMKKVSAHFIVPDAPFRIYRDTRFSADKSPYKTHAGVQLRHVAGKDVHVPGFYLHFEPDSVFFAAGLWQPDSATLGKVRDALVADPARWKRLIGARAFRERLALGGEMLKRAPSGYDPAHPLIEDLKRKDFIVSADYDEAAACAPDFVERVESDARTATPFMKFLTESAGFAW